MSFLAPFGLLALGSLPVLLWLWRLASTHRETRVPSLVPFVHLLKRPPRRRTRLFVNLLFWLQLASLCLLALALAQPVLVRSRAKTFLIVVDTSASMAARLRGPSAMDRAKRLLRSRIARKRAPDRYLLITSAPVHAVTAEPTADAAALTQAVATLEAHHLGGNLGTTAQIGRGLLGGAADAIWVVTDEAKPNVVEEPVEFLTVHQPLPNVAIVGLDAKGSLCSGEAPRLSVALQNFSDDATTIQVTAQQQGRRLAESSLSMEPRARNDLSLTLGEDVDGWIEVVVHAGRDALPVDNRAWTRVRRRAELPVAVMMADAQRQRLIGEWLGACEGLVWTDGPHAQSEAHLVITDLPAPRDVGSGTARLPVPSRTGWQTGQAGATDRLGPGAVGALRLAGAAAFPRPAGSDGRPPQLSPETGRGGGPQAVLAHWVVERGHPISAYLPMVEPVAAVLASPPASASFPGEPVVWGLVHGERVPLVVAGEEDGRKTVSFFLDPTASPASTPLLVIFFNSLRWLMGQADGAGTGEALSVPVVEAGTVAVRRPDGTTERFSHPGGTFRYHETTAAGLYHVSFGMQDVIRAMNFLDPLESNLLEAPSTWRSLPDHKPTAPDASTAHLPLVRLFGLMILVLLTVEWWLSGRRSTG